jgi:hypothetical protein
MGFIRKALYIATGGLSGLVFKDNSKEKRPAKVAAKQAPARKQAKRATGRQTKRATRRPATRAARASTVAAPGNPTLIELERLTDLHGRGALTAEEFAAAKAKMLGTSPPFEADRAPSTFPAVEANVAAARQLADLAVHDTPVAAISRD